MQRFSHANMTPHRLPAIFQALDFGDKCEICARINFSIKKYFEMEDAFLAC